MLFPMIQASQLIALQTPGLFMPQTCCRPAWLRVVPDHRDARPSLRYRQRWRPCFSPAGFPSPATLGRVTTACAAAATPSHDGLHSLRNRLPSGGAGDLLRGAVGLGLRGPTATAGSQARRGTAKYPPARPAGGRGRVARRVAPHRLVAAGASVPPPGV